MGTRDGEKEDSAAILKEEPTRFAGEVEVRGYIEDDPKVIGLRTWKVTSPAIKMQEQVCRGCPG